MTVGRIPVIPTILVVAAATVMVALGVWQLGRADEKKALIAQYEANRELPVIVNFGVSSSGDVIVDGTSKYLEDSLFRRVEISCDQPVNWKSVAGRNANDQSGYVHMFECDRLSLGFNGDTVEIVLYATIGWSRSPQQPEWDGGTLTGILSTAGNDYEVVASEPLAGLQPLARPDPADLPNNHLAYAGQWFFFALTALVIYWLALRKRWREQG